MHQQMGLIILSWRILLRQPMCATCRSSCRSPFVQLWIWGYMYMQCSECITLADGSADLLKFLIIHRFFLWPPAQLFNTYNAMHYRLNYLLQARLMAGLPE